MRRGSHKILYYGLPLMLWEQLYVVDDHWIWTGHTERGYGSYNKKLVHRLVYQAFHGPISRDFHLHHRCPYIRCANPLHLDYMSAREHIALHHRRGDFNV